MHSPEEYVSRERERADKELGTNRRHYVLYRGYKRMGRYQMVVTRYTPSSFPLHCFGIQILPYYGASLQHFKGPASLRYLRHRRLPCLFLTGQLSQFRAMLFDPGNHKAYFPAGRKHSKYFAEFVLLNHAVFWLPGTNISILGCGLFSSVSPKRLRCRRYNEAHERDVARLKAQVAGLQQSDVNIMIFSHWSPPIEGCSQITCTFSTNLPQEPWFKSDKVKVWAFGHTHYNCDFASSARREAADPGLQGRMRSGWGLERATPRAERSTYEVLTQIKLGHIPWMPGCGNNADSLGLTSWRRAWSRRETVALESRDGGNKMRVSVCFVAVINGHLAQDRPAYIVSNLNADTHVAMARIHRMTPLLGYFLERTSTFTNMSTRMGSWMQTNFRPLRTSYTGLRLRKKPVRV
ncbi:hypothetical protein ACRALDRAFT_208247 [Sodiomyces alcalophilus JCM 7366]|uniref:uncharacterized protein n=1 Tax=Sodiomyces alcalophilus JCM 7366 TaxID=591952 RepID=UPI0039B68322